MMRSCLLMVVIQARNAAIVLVLPVSGGPSMIDKGASSTEGKHGQFTRFMHPDDLDSRCQLRQSEADPLL